jgi:hypothetical protein
MYGLDGRTAMSDLYDVPTTDPAFVPDDADRAGIADWFDRYDRLAAAGDTTPGRPGPCSRSTSSATIREATVSLPSGRGSSSSSRWPGRWGAARGDVSLRSNRTPHFLTSSLVVVVTEAQMTGGGASTNDQVRRCPRAARRGLGVPDDDPRRLGIGPAVTAPQW